MFLCPTFFCRCHVVPTVVPEHVSCQRGLHVGMTKLGWHVDFLEPLLVGGQRLHPIVLAVHPQPIIWPKRRSLVGLDTQWTEMFMVLLMCLWSTCYLAHPAVVQHAVERLQSAMTDPVLVEVCHSTGHVGRKGEPEQLSIWIWN